jgi:glycosyltransferase involved in cell wall biosynthesis
MRIGIDVRYLSHGLVGGVHTYMANFVPTLVYLAPTHQFYLYADTKRPFELERLPSHVTLRYLPWHSPLSSVYHDFFMWRQMERDRLDVVHYPANYGFGPPSARTIITVHDALTLTPLSTVLRRLPKTPRTIAMTVYLHYCSRRALKYAHLLLTVSNQAKYEIARYGQFDPNRIIYAPHAPTPDFRRIDDPKMLADVRQRHKLTYSFVLADGLKNPAVLIEAWRRLPTQSSAGRRIVFFARRPDVLPIVHQAVAAGEAELLIKPSREDLIALYSMAEAFIFPSWIEGFGIPLLEAMVCGAPVIASNRGAIPEVLGDAGLLADAEDAETFSQHIAAVLGSSDLAGQLRERGFARAQQFSWHHTAQRILECYEQAVRDFKNPGRHSIVAID